MNLNRDDYAFDCTSEPSCLAFPPSRSRGYASACVKDFVFQDYGQNFLKQLGVSCITVRLRRERHEWRTRYFCKGNHYRSRASTRSVDWTSGPKRSRDDEVAFTLAGKSREDERSRAYNSRSGESAGASFEARFRDFERAEASCAILLVNIATNARI